MGARHQVRAEIDLTSALTSRPSDHTEALPPLKGGNCARTEPPEGIKIRRSSTGFKKSLRNTKEMLILSVGRLTRRAPQRRLCSRESRPSKQAKRRQAARLRSAVQVVGVLNFHLLREGGYYDSRPLYQLSVNTEKLTRPAEASERGSLGGPVRSSWRSSKYLRTLTIASSGTGCGSGLSLTE